MQIGIACRIAGNSSVIDPVSQMRIETALGVIEERRVPAEIPHDRLGKKSRINSRQRQLSKRVSKRSDVPPHPEVQKWRPPFSSAALRAEPKHGKAGNSAQTYPPAGTVAGHKRC